MMSCMSRLEPLEVFRTTGMSCRMVQRLKTINVRINNHNRKINFSQLAAHETKAGNEARKSFIMGLVFFPSPEC